MELKEYYKIGDMHVTYITCIDRLTNIYKGTDGIYYLVDEQSQGVIGKIIGQIIKCTTKECKDIEADD